MTAMNTFDRTESTPTDHRAIVRVPATERASESQQSECCCPELCQLDHSN